MTPVLLLFLLVAGANHATYGQEADRLGGEKLAGLSLYRDNFLIASVPGVGGADRPGSDAVFQISFKQRVTRNLFGSGIACYGTYSQTAFWDVYRTSFPIRDINYRPGAFFSKLIYRGNEQPVGRAEFVVHHTSNGLPGKASRSLNRLSLGYTFPVSRGTTINLRAWYLWGYGVGKHNYLDYIGLAGLNVYHEFKPDVAYARLTINKGLNLDDRGLVRTRLYWNPLPKVPGNHYLLLEWYLGYAESLLEYEQFQSTVRIGYAIRAADLFSL